MAQRVVFSEGELRTEDGGGIPSSAFTSGDQAAGIDDTAALTSSEAAGAAPDAAEFDALVADVAAVHANQLLILAALRTYGVIAPVEE